MSTSQTKRYPSEHNYACYARSKVDGRVLSTHLFVHDPARIMGADGFTSLMEQLAKKDFPMEYDLHGGVAFSTEFLPHDSPLRTPFPGAADVVFPL